VTDKIKCLVGEQMRSIDMNVFLDVHARLADYYRALGLEGDRLDLAIVEALPQQLAHLLDAPSTTQH
jgi:hypothetical protein